MAGDEQSLSLAGLRPVDARGAVGVQVGDGNVQIVYSYNRTWTDGVVPPPISDVRGSVDSPYRGLNSFDERDAAFFFGRERAATDILERMTARLADPQPLIVSGVSGAGKSSLLRAGVLHRFRGVGLPGATGSRLWPCLLFAPGVHPLAEVAVQLSASGGLDASTVLGRLWDDPATARELARQVAVAGMSEPDRSGDGRAAGRIVVMIDQFEQVFTQCESASERQAFVHAVAAMSGSDPDDATSAPALVVIGVRADFEARCADFPELAEAVQNRYLVTSMTETELRQAITAPAEKIGGGVESWLVEILIRKAALQSDGLESAVQRSGAGVLPLLSHALDAAWRDRQSDTLTAADYDRAGGLEGAIARSADRAYARLTPAQQAEARLVFTRLTVTDADGVDTAGRASTAELLTGRTPAQQTAINTVIEAFVAERLLTVAADSVEISHEALLSAWPLLRDVWLADDRADRVVRTRLQATANEWADHDHDPAYLYAGALLETATATATRIAADPARFPPLTTTTADFLTASTTAAQRRARRRRIITITLTGLVILLTLATIIALTQYHQATQQRDRARAETRIAVSRQLAAEAVSLRQARPASSLVASLEALRQAKTEEASSSLASTLATTHLERVLRRSGPPALTGAWSPDGRELLLGNEDGSLEMWTIVGSQFKKRWDTPATGNRPHSMAVAPNGTILAVGDEYGAVRLWSLHGAHTPSLAGALPGGTDDWSRIRFDPNSGKLLAVGATVTVWDVEHPLRPRRVAELAAETVRDAAFTADGRGVVVASDPGGTRLYELSATTRPVWQLPGAFGVAVAPDGDAMVTVPRDQDAILWQLHGARPPTRIGPLLAPSSQPAEAAAFDGLGQMLAISQYDGTTTMWDVRKVTLPHLVTSVAGHLGVVAEPVVAPDGHQVATLGEDGVVNLWSATPEQAPSLVGTWGPFNGAPEYVAFAAKGTLVVGSDGNTPDLWDISDLASVKRIGSIPTNATDFPVTAGVSSSLDGRMLAVSNGTSTTLWAIDGRNRRQLATVPGSHATLGPDQLLATGDYLRTTLWNIADPRAPSRIANLQGGSAAFTHDGHLMSTGNVSSTQLWDISAGRPKALGTLRGAMATFGRSGLAGTALNGNALLWDIHDPQHPTKLAEVPSAGIQQGPAFSPDGRLAATGTSESSPRLWDISEPSAPTLLTTLQGHRGSVYNLTFNLAGTLLATSSFDMHLKLWDVSRLEESSREPARAACGIIGTDFPRRTWRATFPTIPYHATCG